MLRLSTRLFSRATAFRPRRLLFAAGVLAAVPLGRASAQLLFPRTSLCDRLAGNLVPNCGFEDGVAATWQFSEPPGSELAVTALPTSAHTGRHYLRFSNDLPDSPPSSVLAQFATTPGAEYTFSFYLVSNAVGGEPAATAAFQAFWDGQQVFDLAGQGPNFDSGYARHSVVRTATAARTEVRFEAFNWAASYYLDDVSVTPAVVAVTPEPATVALVGAGVAALGALARRRRRG